MQDVKQYYPFFGLVLAAVMQSVYVAVGDNVLTAAEGLSIGVTMATAVTTYVVPRVPGALWLKRGAAGLGAVLTVFFNAVSAGGVSAQTYVLGGLALLGALGVVLTDSNVKPLSEPRHAAVTGVGGMADLDPAERRARDERGAIQNGSAIWTVVGVLLIIALLVWLIPRLS